MLHGYCNAVKIAGTRSLYVTLKGTKRVTVGRVITATATNGNGSTSEFSAPKSAVRQ
jgi:hypothetical protein